MKLLLALLLVANCCVAQQNFLVVNKQQKPIAGVSVFLVGKFNELIDVSDENGQLKIHAAPNSTYLIHALGYEDLQFNTDELSKKVEITLQTAQYQLKEVSVGAAKEFIIEKPIRASKAHFFNISDIPQTSNIQRVN